MVGEFLPHSLASHQQGNCNGTVRNIHGKFHFPLLSDYVEDLVGRVQWPHCSCARYSRSSRRRFLPHRPAPPPQLAAARPFVTAVHCSDKENILSVDVVKYLSLLAGKNDHKGRPVQFDLDWLKPDQMRGTTWSSKSYLYIPLPHLPIPSDTAQKKKCDPLVQSTSPVY